MAIEEIDIDLDLSSRPLPAQVARLIRETDRRWEQFFADDGTRRLPRFVPSEGELVFAALDYVTRHELPPGRVFCEWGSGFGTGTCLAALLGYEAYGIEIQPELVELSREIARHLDIPVEILCTSYIPEGFESYSGVGGEELVKSRMFAYPGEEEDTDLQYDGMACDIAEIDLFFAYPWPEEQELMQQLFDAVAADGAILIAYHSAKEICAFRKLFRCPKPILEHVYLNSSIFGVGPTRFRPRSGAGNVPYYDMSHQRRANAYIRRSPCPDHRPSDVRNCM